jgi:hypothetical protein
MTEIGAIIVGILIGAALAVLLIYLYVRGLIHEVMAELDQHIERAASTLMPVIVERMNGVIFCYSKEDNQFICDIDFALEQLGKSLTVSTLSEADFQRKRIDRLGSILLDFLFDFLRAMSLKLHIGPCSISRSLLTKVRKLGRNSFHSPRKNMLIGIVRLLSHHQTLANSKK